MARFYFGPELRAALLFAAEKAQKLGGNLTALAASQTQEQAVSRLVPSLQALIGLRGVYEATKDHFHWQELLGVFAHLNPDVETITPAFLDFLTNCFTRGREDSPPGAEGS